MGEGSKLKYQMINLSNEEKVINKSLSHNMFSAKVFHLFLAISAGTTGSRDMSH